MTRSSISTSGLAIVARTCAFAGALLLVSGTADARYAGFVSLTAADATFTGTTLMDAAGDSVASGDFNCDGISDVLIGAPLADLAGSASGAAYIVFGSM